MPYSVGKKGSYGCSGYPALKDGTNEVMGCHETQEEAMAQIYAINQSEGNIEEKDTITNSGGMGIKNPQAWPGSKIKDPKLKKKSVAEGDFVMGSTSEGVIHGVVEHIMNEGGILGTPGSEYALVSMPPENPAMSVRIYKEEDGKWKPTAYSIGMMYKDAQVADINNHKMGEENDMDSEVAMAMYDSQVGKSYKEEEEKIKKEYEGCGCPMCKELNVTCEECPQCQAGEMKSDCCANVNKQAPCWDGYVQRGMKPGENGKPVPNCVPAAKADDLWEDDDTVEYETDSVLKAEGYSPPAGARSAARRAIKFKEDGKATGAGTAVGWTRAGQLARGETISLSTVKRMFSYFSRHEVDKKGKDWGNSANPSNGYIMWLAWGGDAGFSWSRGIVNREKDKALFADFGKDYTKVQRERHSL